MPKPEFNCPLTLETMIEPVSTPCHHTFEAAALREWVRRNPSCPVCRAPFPAGTLFPENAAVREAIRRELGAELARVPVFVPPPADPEHEAIEQLAQQVGAHFEADIAHLDEAEFDDQVLEPLPELPRPVVHNAAEARAALAQDFMQYDFRQIQPIVRRGIIEEFLLEYEAFVPQYAQAAIRAAIVQRLAQRNFRDELARGIPAHVLQGQIEALLIPAPAVAAAPPAAQPALDVPANAHRGAFEELLRLDAGNRQRIAIIAQELTIYNLHTMADRGRDLIDQLLLAHADRIPDFADEQIRARIAAELMQHNFQEMVAAGFIPEAELQNILEQFLLLHAMPMLALVGVRGPRPEPVQFLRAQMDAFAPAARPAPVVLQPAPPPVVFAAPQLAAAHRAAAERAAAERAAAERAAAAQAAAAAPAAPAAAAAPKTAGNSLGMRRFR